MGNQDIYSELVVKAGQGDKDSLNKLAEKVRPQLYVYVFRLTLDNDLTEDIVQESLIEMFRFLEKLEKSDSFWPWLRRIALNKIHRHYKNQQKRKAVSMSDIGYDSPQPNPQEGFADLVQQELRQIVINAMQKLSPRHREVLVLRCYEQMRYSQIAEEMNSSEFAVRMLFLRAKKALAKELSREGLGKGSLLMALALFGKMTAPTEAAAAEITITAATVNAGIAASVAVAVTSKTALVSLTAAAAISAGTVLAPAVINSDDTPLHTVDVQAVKVIRSLPQYDEKNFESWIFFPQGASGPVMTRLMQLYPDGRQNFCCILENGQANYHFDQNSGIVYIDNFHYWNSDLSVRVLPTDDPQMVSFIEQNQNRPIDMDYISNGMKGLLIISRRVEHEIAAKPRIEKHINVLEEEYYRFDWSAGTRVVDRRDQMHQRGWTYFTVSGSVNGVEVTGAGRLPFAYAKFQQNRPWLVLNLANGFRIVDSVHGSAVVDSSNNVVYRFSYGSFFAGLSRPWMGLHTIDIIRRDAAAEHIAFDSRMDSDSNYATVTLTTNSGKIVYTIDMYRDVVSSIEFFQAEKSIGRLDFSYMQNLAGTQGFTEPFIRSGGKRADYMGIEWLSKLGFGSLIDW